MNVYQSIAGTVALLLGSAFSVTATAAPARHPVSALRALHQTYLERALEVLPDAPEGVETPWTSQRPVDQLNLEQVPEVRSASQLQKIFESVRDAREWRWDAKPDFARRIPWLYVDDGCYLRAEMIVEKLRYWDYVIPKQIMAFGDLQGWSEYGSAPWWYHVAPILRVGTQAYVLDPSVEGRRPLTLKDWLLRMTPDVRSATAAICNADTVDPNTDCALQSSDWDPSYEADQLQFFLGQEWGKLAAFLGFEPLDLLGDKPPWSRRR